MNASQLLLSSKVDDLIMQLYIQATTLFPLLEMCRRPGRSVYPDWTCVSSASGPISITP